MRQRYKRKTIIIFWIILLVLVLVWWIGGEIYNPYPPSTPTPGYWPTRVTATIVPSATPTEVIHTPIQPTIGYTATPYEPPVKITNTPVPPTFTPVLISTATSAPTPVPILYKSVEDKEYTCVTYFIRPWGIKTIYRCWQPAWWRLPFVPPSIFIP